MLRPSTAQTCYTFKVRLRGAISRWGPWGLCVGVALASLVCLWCEPIWSDGWYNYFVQQEQPFSLTGLGNVTSHNYLHGNPRIGEDLLYLLYAPGHWHVLLSFATNVAAVWLLATIGLARQPRARDALYMTTLVALLLVAVPRVGSMLFFRPYQANYIAGALPALGLLALYRCQLRAALPHPRALIPAALVLGFVGGMGNEHTGIAFIAVMLGALGVARREQRAPLWMWLGVAAFALGYYLLLKAPGQMERYAGAARVGVWATIKARSFAHNAIVVAAAPLLAVWLLPWVALARNQRQPQAAGASATADAIDPRRAFGVALLVALLVGVTLLASPRSAPRLYFASTALLCCTGAAWITAQLSRCGQRRMWWLNASVIAFSLTALTFFSVRTHREYTARTAIVMAAPPGSQVVVPPLSSVWWQYSLHDDWRNPSLRVYVAGKLGLASIDIGNPMLQVAKLPKSAQ